MKNQHTGSGTLRGGGVRRVYGNRPTFKEYKRKMDYRLGFVTILSLATIMTILFIYGLFHMKGNDALTEYVSDTKHFIESEEPYLTTPSGEKSDEKREIPLTEIESHEHPPEAEEDEVPEHHTESGSKEKEDVTKETKDEEPALLLLPTSTAAILTSEPVEETTTPTEPVETSTEPIETSTEPIALSSTTIEETTSTTTTATTTTTPTTTTTTTTTEATTVALIIDTNRLTIEELDRINARLHSTYITIWNLAGLNLIVLLFLVPLTYLFYIGYFKTSLYKTIYRVVLILVLIFLIVQLIYLINPLFTSAFTFPSTIDRLFSLETYPREEAYIKKVESRYACKFETHEVLVSIGYQDPCIPKIKDSLFPTYAVVLLIIIDLLPFAFAIFTYAWDAWIKDSKFVRNTRLRIEENNQRRPQTREQILNRTLAQGYESNRNSEAHNLA